MEDDVTLDCFEVSGDDPDSSSKKRVQYLESCVDDLISQNRTLVSVVIDLEAETENRVKAAETFLERTAKSAKTYMVALSGHEQFVRNLVKDSSKALTTIKRLQDKVSVLEDENGALQERNDSLCHDIGSLVRLINHARNTGQWDVGNIEFCEVSFEDVFGSVEQFSDCTSVEELDHFDSASGIISNSSAIEDYGIKTLFGDRTGSVRSYGSSARTVSGMRPTRRDAQIHRLQGELRRAQQQVASVHTQLSDRDRMIAKLQVEIADLNHDATMKESELEVHCQKLRLEKPPSKANRNITLARHWMSCDGSPDVVVSIDRLDKSLAERSEQNVLHPKSNKNSRKEELKAILIGLNRDNSRLKAELGLMKCTKVPRQLNGVRDAEIQAEMDCDVSDELCRLRGLEERQRLKAFGLEVAVQQLTVDLGTCRQAETKLRAEVQSLENYKFQMEELDLKMLKLEEIVVAKDADLELQRRTIGNLRDTIVALKRQDRSHLAAGKQKPSFSNSEKSINGISATENVLLSRTQSKSGEIFDI